MKNKSILISAIGLFAAFILWTALLSFVDVAAIGPDASSVGFATVNGSFHCFTGVNMWLYTVTDWLGLVPIATALGFAVLGLIQWIKRTSIFKVDRSIIVLGGFYIAVIAAYVFFECVEVNCRPVLINGYLETSYPSSTTMLVLCVMSTAVMQFRERIKHPIVRTAVVIAIVAFIAFMVIGRLFSGVHWLSDIIGGALLSCSLIAAYRFAV